MKIMKGSLGSFLIVIPRALIRSLNWKFGDQLESAFHVDKKGRPGVFIYKK